MKTATRTARIKRVLRQRRKEYSKSEQWSEYLKRNNHFLETLEQIQKRFKCLPDKGYEGHEGVIVVWEDFCRKYGIAMGWNGQLDELPSKLYPPVLLDSYIGMSVYYIKVAVSRCATLADVTAIWPKVEKMQNEMGKKLSASTNFSRDLCWHDLSVDLGLKVREIAELWDKYYPEDIDVLVVANMKREGIIHKDDLNGKAIWDDNRALCQQIQTGFLAVKLKRHYLEHREWYVRGIVKRGATIRKVQSNLEDTIRKAVIRMQQSIQSVSRTKY